MIKVITELRMPDKWGQGHYGASRGKKKDGTPRTHNGIDLSFTILSPISGKVTKIGRVYSDPKKSQYRYVQITCDDLNYRIFYVDPEVEVGNDVKQDDPLGTLQDLGEAYPGITPHIHFEIKKDGRHLDPTPFVGGEK